MDPEQINVADHLVPSISYVDLAWIQQDVRLAELHAERAFSMAVRSGSPYLQAYAMATRGLAHIVAGRPGSAIEDLSAAIDGARRRKAGLEYEPRMLADLANAYRLNGDLDAALRTADEAIDAATTRNTRIAECLARIARARTLLASGGHESIKDELGRIKALIEETGAKAYEPLLHDLEASLTPGTRVADKPGAARRGLSTPLAS